MNERVGDISESDSRYRVIEANELTKKDHVRIDDISVFLLVYTLCFESFIEAKWFF